MIGRFGDSHSDRWESLVGWQGRTGDLQSQREEIVALPFWRSSGKQALRIDYCLVVAEEKTHRVHSKVHLKKKKKSQSTLGRPRALEVLGPENCPIPRNLAPAAWTIAEWGNVWGSAALSALGSESIRPASKGWRASTGGQSNSWGECSRFHLCTTASLFLLRYVSDW